MQIPIHTFHNSVSVYICYIVTLVLLFFMCTTPQGAASFQKFVLLLDYSREVKLRVSKLYIIFLFISNLATLLYL